MVATVFLSIVRAASCLWNYVPFNDSRPGPRIQRGSHRTHQEGEWLLLGWKSNSSQQEERAEFTEDTERADTDGVLRNRARK